MNVRQTLTLALCLALVSITALRTRLALAAPEAPCATIITTGTVSLVPRTPLERIYFATAVCWRRRAFDAQAAVRTATATLAAADAVPPAPAADAPPASVPVLWVALGAVGAAVVGVLGFVLGFEVRRQ